MASFNKVILMGNLTADPELKQTQSGLSVTSFDIGVRKRASAEYESNFFHITAWRQSAEFVCRYFKKGDSIIVCGSLDNRYWTDNNGNKRITTEIVADEVSFAGSKAADNAVENKIEVRSAKNVPKSSNIVTPKDNTIPQNANTVPSQFSMKTPMFEEIKEQNDLPF